ncbi:hypothetical protein [Vibrio phage vB_VibM_10AMN]|uniref:Uncharacterized protein n=1 Tax=Staphylococcus phage vB_VibM_10AMN12 TaxID=3076785 RepID=A0AA96R6J0_9CAUD|nr:hypothetical protein [Vibrio phage vB_VibM_10AMN]WNO47397.1 hypothetical protein [Staphylococcus phage vB_VibM_10AMN12]
MLTISDYNMMNDQQQKAVRNFQETKQSIIDCQTKDCYIFWEWLHDQLIDDVKMLRELGIKA